jgi:histidine phosphotransferase ChpT
VTLGWQLPRVLLPKNRVKLLLNLLLLATTIIPRGGTITAEMVDGEAGGFRVSAKGLIARVPHAVPALVTGETEGPVDAHAIQPFYAGLLARTCGLAISIEQQAEQIVITAQ